MEPSVEAAREGAKEAVEAVDSASLGTRPTGRFARPRSKLALVVAIVAAIILLTILLPGASGTKYTDVREITAAPATYNGKTVAVVGGVQNGSVQLFGGAAFNLTDYSDANVWIRVVYKGEPVNNLQGGKTVLAEGVIQAGAAGELPKLFATKLSIGCPTDYRGATPPPQ